MAKQTWEEHIILVNRESSSLGLISGQEAGKLGAYKVKERLHVNFKIISSEK